MRRGFIVLLVVAIFLAAAPVYAAPVGNVASPAMYKKAGLAASDDVSNYGFLADGEFDITTDRKIKDQDSDTKFNFYGAKAGVVIYNKALLYGIIGAGEAEQEFNVSGSKVKWDTKNDAVWGLGASLILFETKVGKDDNSGTLRIGADARYRSIDLDIRKIILNGTEYKIPASEVTAPSYKMGEWQGALAVSFQIDRFVPYVGAKYSYLDGSAKATISGKEYKEDFKSDDNFGVFFGSDLMLTDSLSLRAEGRLIDETAFTADISARF